jgi:hypothetical protein
MAILERIEGYTRHLLNDRRERRRKRVDYDTVVRSDAGELIFRGSAMDVCEGGVKIRGLPVRSGVEVGMHCRVQFLIVPKEWEPIVRRPEFGGAIVRIEDTDDEYKIAVAFDRPYDG